MPRGIRAVHGAEVGHQLHQSGRNATRIAADPRSLLEVQCWCAATDVLVPQWELRLRNRTRSCGLPGCAAPDGDRTPGPLAPGRHKPRSGRGGITGRTGLQHIYHWYAEENGLWAAPTP